MKEADRRLASLIIYIAHRCERAIYFGKTKLNKILFYADFSHYAKNGNSITGQEYMKLPQGPAPRGMLPVLEVLTAQRKIHVRQEHAGPRLQERVIALDLPDDLLEGFSGEEIARVDRAIEVFWDHTGTNLSRLSHEFIGWQLAAPGETIPYSTVLLSDRALSSSEMEYGRKLAEELGVAEEQ